MTVANIRVCWRWDDADDDFQQLQDSYCERHCAAFENTAENKLEYTRIFDGYVRIWFDLGCQLFVRQCANC